MAIPEPTIIQWYVDTRKMWYVSGESPPKEQMQEFKHVARDSLILLPDNEQQAVLKYYFVRDAKLSLASYLLKHLVITKYGNIPWNESIICKDEHGKPCYRPKTTEGSNIDFNVSHQAGIVTLVASPGMSADIGTDVVCVNERNENNIIERDGFFSWVDLHADVFAPSEVQSMKFDVDHLILPDSLKLSGSGQYTVSRCQHRDRKLSLLNSTGEVQEVNSTVIIDAKLRRFYAFWCLREAYVKMTGEALLADWLPKLEFRAVKVPTAHNESFTDNLDLRPGEVVKDFEIYMSGEKVSDTVMELASFGHDYMFASAIRPRNGQAHILLPGFTELNLEKELLPVVQIAAGS